MATVRRRRGSETTRAILYAALDELTERGYAALTMDRVAERAGASKATLYRRWANKQELLLEAAGLVVAPVPSPDRGAFAAELHGHLQARLGLYADERGRRLVASLIGAAPTDPDLSQALVAWLSEVTRSTQAMIERGRLRGDVRTDIDASAVATLISGPMVYRAVVEQLPPDEAFVDDLVVLITAAVAPG
ncbi:MAG: TetR/AcrR family transcriptional regulator [Acidimicrobiales bacterium]